MFRIANFSIFFVLIVICCNCNQINSSSNWTEPVTGMEFIQISKGSFLMGNRIDSNNQSYSDTLHKVILSKDFWLGKTEVTQKQWQIIMGYEEMHPDKPSPFLNKNPEYPVVSVSYFDIQNFLDKLNKLSEENYFRLPTEAEWEYACRAGTATLFSFGNYISDSLANYNAEIPSIHSVSGKFVGHPMPVGSYPSNPWKLSDMHGNVWEWVEDWYAPYSSLEATDPTGPSVGKLKVIRGGSWYFGADNALSSYRRTHEPESWGFSIGFRIIREKK